MIRKSSQDATYLLIHSTPLHFQPVNHKSRQTQRTKVTHKSKCEDARGGFPLQVQTYPCSNSYKLTIASFCISAVVCHNCDFLHYLGNTPVCHQWWHERYERDRKKIQIYIC